MERVNHLFKIEELAAKIRAKQAQMKQEVEPNERLRIDKEIRRLQYNREIEEIRMRMSQLR